MGLTSRIPEIAAALSPEVMVAVEAGAETIVEAAKARVPVDTGRLRDAIHTEIEGAGVYVVAGDREAFYGHIIEHGSVYAPARPFLLPALEETRAAVLAEVEAAIRRAT
jgi:HK97 gp10 family phage protein